MIRNLKVLGLAIAAVLAVSAFGASAASAAEFHSEAENTTVSGTQTEGNPHVFTTDPGKVTCKTATFAGSQTGKTATDITITPTYKDCTLATIFGNIAVEVKTNGCTYTFTSHINTETVHILCPAGQSITVSGPGCTVTVPGGQTLGGITYANKGSGSSRDIEVNVDVTGAHGTIKYSYSGFTCGSGTNTTNGTYTGVATVTGSAGIWWE